MCGIYSNPYETARSLTVAAAPKIVVNQTGKTIEESNIELAKQMALVYKTLLRELQREEEEVEGIHNHEHTHDGHTHTHDHDHEHEHEHNHTHSH